MTRLEKIKAALFVCFEDQPDDALAARANLDVLENTALLLKLAEAASERPWLDSAVNDFGCQECGGCQRHGVEQAHAPKCRFKGMEAAIAPLMETTT